MSEFQSIDHKIKRSFQASFHMIEAPAKPVKVGTQVFEAGLKAAWKPLWQKPDANYNSGVLRRIVVNEIQKVPSPFMRTVIFNVIAIDPGFDNSKKPR